MFFGKRSVRRVGHLRVSGPSGGAPRDDRRRIVERVQRHPGVALRQIGKVRQNIVARVAVKPTPTIAKDQKTIDKVSNENKVLSAVTRRDPTIVPRVWPVAEALMAIILLDNYMQHVAYQSFFKK